MIRGENTTKAWERKASALQAIGGNGLQHFASINAIISREDERYLVLPWANGGNLMDFWKAHDGFESRRFIARNLLPEIFQQLLGLAGALLSIHEFEYRGRKGVYRHGDLKPESILIFEGKSKCGTWKNADLGLAQFHENTTRAREAIKVSATSTAMWGTTSYQPPETARQFWEASLNRDVPPTSRLYDIWSMGCIILQLIVWLIYGLEELKNLNARTRGIQSDASTFYTARETFLQGSPGLDVRVHHEVEQLIRRIRENLKGSWALLRLLEVVQQKLLVIPLPNDSTVEEARCRTTASGLRSSLQEIWNECETNPGCWSATKDLVQDSKRENPARENWGWDADEGYNTNLNEAMNTQEIATRIRQDPDLRGDINYSQQQYDSGIGTSTAQDSSNQLMSLSYPSEAFSMLAIGGTDETCELGTVHTRNSDDSIAQKAQTNGTDLAARLCHDLSLWTNGEEDVRRISDCLPRILQIFAFKIPERMGVWSIKILCAFCLSIEGVSISLSTIL